MRGGACECQMHTVTRTDGFPRVSPLLNLHELRGAHLEEETTCVSTSHFRVNLLVTSAGCHRSGQGAIECGFFHRGSANRWAWELKRNMKLDHTPHTHHAFLHKNQARFTPGQSALCLTVDNRQLGERKPGKQESRDNALAPSPISGRVQAGDRPRRTTSLMKRRLPLNS